VLLQAVDRSARVSPNRLELSLLPDSDVASIINLAQREAACCPFFPFAMEIQIDRLTLAVEVPDDAVEIPDQFGSSAQQGDPTPACEVRHPSTSRCRQMSGPSPLLPILPEIYGEPT